MTLISQYEIVAGAVAIELGPLEGAMQIIYQFIASFEAIFVNSWLFLIAVVVTIFAGFIRGFAQIGAGVIFIPVLSTQFRPILVGVSFIILDWLASLLTLRQETKGKTIDWKDVWRVTVPAWIMAILAGYVLGQIAFEIPEVAFRYIICGLATFAIISRICSFRLWFEGSAVRSIAIGMLAGLLSVSIQLSGPIVALHWLPKLATYGPNLLAYFALISPVTVGGVVLREKFEFGMLVFAVSMFLFYFGSWEAGKWVANKHVKEVKRRRSVAYICVASAILLGWPWKHFIGLFGI